jgi:hypothetical protein
VFYVSYDGLAEPLGRSQILPYLVRLAPLYRITLVSFEKSHDGQAQLQTELAGHEIEWLPLSYHRSASGGLDGSRRPGREAGVD